MLPWSHFSFRHLYTAIEERRCKSTRQQLHGQLQKRSEMASPISAQQPTQQRSAEESQQQFDTKMFDMVTRMESTADTIFFYKLVSKCMVTKAVQGPFAYSLEFPMEFVRQHGYGKKFGLDLTFVLKDSQRAWPIKLTVRTFKQTKPRVFAFGAGGWKNFLMDNRVKVGDVLILSLISHSQFEVFIGRAPVEVHRDDNGEGSGNEGEGEADVDIGVVPNASCSRNANQAAPPCPGFLVAVLPPSHPGRLSLVVPGRFWDLHANMLQSNDLRLRGPNKAMFTVNAKQTFDVEEVKLSVCLDSGWEAFIVANKLRVGDILEFFLVGKSRFTVDLLEPIAKN